MLNKRIPALSSKVDPEVRRAIEILAEGLPSSVSDVPAIQNAISYLKSIGGTSYVAISAPTNFTATGAFKSILLSWSDNQIGKTVVGYEIYRANVNDLGSAARVAFVSATIYSDIPPDTSTSVVYYYWIRAIGHNNNASGFVGPASASTSTDPAYVLEILQNQITESQLYEDLNSRIDLIDTPTTGLVDSLQTEIINRENGDNALAQQISTLSVSSNEQFDSAKIWHFDNDVEGWSGNGTPTESNGWIKQADHASDPYLVSPTGVGVNGVAYQRIRLRYKKTGSPTWEGYIWWKREGDTDWDTSRRITVSEPSYDIDNIANIFEEITWDGTIDQIRIDLISAQDSSNYTEIDWVAIGRAAPGASVAALQEEKTARINGDNALASDVTTLQTTVDGHTASIQEHASSIDGLNAQYTIKIDNNGFMSGYGLASTGVNGTPFSEFYVQANRFAVINPEVPPKVVTSITRSGTLATCTVPSHGFITGKYHVITGAEQPEYNGAHLITVVDSNTFTFYVSGSPATPATVAPGLSNIYVSGSEAAIPFIVQNGVNYLDTAMIKELTADKITAGQMSGDRIAAGTLDATTFKSSMGIVSVLQSPGFGSGNGWKLDGPNGTFEITSWGNVSSGANDLPQAFADVTNYQSPLIANNKTQNGLTTIPYPGGGSQRYTSSSVQGAIVITLPQSYNDAMVSFVVDVFNYYDQRSFSLYIAGYLYNNGNKWYRTTARIFGGLDADNRVRFTDDGDKACIIIGDTSDTWSYPSITVRNFRAWFNHYDIDLWDDGWSVSIETDLSAYSTPGADYADALLDANAIKNQGALATKDQADWATQVIGAGKPEDNATKGATWGSNINNIPTNIFTGGNLINPTDEWIPGTYGSQGHFHAISGNESRVVNTSVGIFGTTEPIWECIPGSTRDADGGWKNYPVTIEANKTYIFGVYVWKLNDNGVFYLGCDQSTTENLGGNSNTNPYFVSGSLLGHTGKWLLAIGVLHPAGYTGGDTGLSGIYDIETGIKIQDGTEFRSKEGATNQTHRCYHYYNSVGDNATVFQKMARPFIVPSDKFPGIQALTTKLDNIAPNADVTANSPFVNETYPADKANFQNQIDGKITSWFQDSDPNTWPESERDAHDGDMWYSASAKELKRYNASTNSWVLVENQTAIDAFAAASQAQDTADGKRRVFTSTPAPPYDVGDLWSQGPSGHILRCVTARASGDYNASDWGYASNYDNTKDRLEQSVTISAGGITLNGGAIKTAGKNSYADTNPGLWFGKSDDTYKFNLGDSNKSIKWDGSKIIATGAWIDTANIQDLAVSTLKIQDNAVTVPVSAYTEDEIATNNDGGAILQQATINVQGYPVLLFASCLVHPFSDAYSYNIKICRGNTVIWGGNIKAYDCNKYRRGIFSLSLTDNPGNGTFTYYIRGYWGGFSVRNLLLLGVKK